ncbi:MAG: FAD synthase [Candidatus Methanomethylicota archaeon]|uniref:FAD synthase n=1 Tax=Thermoproteota archaeon TaxID=2056631 RepID=A0A497EUU8_9CREN|nr:MAG: FAD synthase [Candidatus Verstraetearchaeota archaeon]RLE52341.1 MAG: FAD synthase [Candidatus Verstraetearchaeota archaeon]
MTKKVRILASGCFDPLHYGHLRYLEEAKKLGGDKAELIVVVARDSTIRKFKGRPPIIPEEQRRALIEALKPVDKAILGYEDVNISAILKEYKPDIVVIGYDQDNLAEKVMEVIEKEQLDTKIVKLDKYCDFSSSQILERLRHFLITSHGK